ncbi:MAG TPA: hypothetical protein VLF16_06225 [Pseudomonas sp.]|nr:hypothetical protein [Pseudomonas sp.]
MRTLYVLTRHDAHDYRAVAEIYYYDEDGEMQIDRKATGICGDIGARDGGRVDAWIQIKSQIAERLKSAGIAFNDIQFD